MIRARFFIVFLLLSGSAFAACGTPLRYFVGESMFPALVSGDRVFVDWLAPSERVFVGDVVVARYSRFKAFDLVVSGSGRKPLYVVHRLYAVDGKDFYLKGDNNVDVDPVVFRRSDIVGVVCAARRKGVLVFATNPRFSEDES